MKRLYGIIIGILLLLFLTGCALASGGGTQEKKEYTAPARMLPVTGTPVIAVNRARTRYVIRGWRDLKDLHENVSISPANLRYVLAAGNYALQQRDGFTEIMSELYTEGRLQLSGEAAAVWLCLDVEAKAYESRGYDVDIVLPAEGSICFSDILAGDAEGKVVPYTEVPDIYGLLQRSEMHFYDSIGMPFAGGAGKMREQILLFVYLFIVVFWTGRSSRLSLRKDVRGFSLALGILLLLWGLLPLLLRQLGEVLGIEAYIHFLHLFYMSALSGMLLCLLVSAGNSSEKEKHTLYKGIFAADLAVTAFCFWGDFRGMPLRYGAYAYYLLKIFIGTLFLLRGFAYTGRRKTVLIPLLLFLSLPLVLFWYTGFIPEYRRIDLSLILGLYTLAFFELSVFAGILPANTNYEGLLKHSTVSFRIYNHQGLCVLESTGRKTAPENVVHREENIRGGHISWEEDVGKLRGLERRLERLTQHLEATNTILKEDDAIRLKYESAMERKRLLQILQAQLEKKTGELSALVQKLRENRGEAHSSAQIMLLLCYIKRKCNLFFRQGESKSLPASELGVYMAELAEFTRYTGTKFYFSSEAELAVETEIAAFLYDFYDILVEDSVKYALSTMVRLSEEEDSCCLHCIISGRSERLKLPREMQDFIADRQGRLVWGELGTAFTLRLAFDCGVKEGL